MTTRVCVAGLAVCTALAASALPLRAARAAKTTAAYQFAPSKGESAASGSLPTAGVVLDPAGSGALFGTTTRGGNTSRNGYGGGVVYEVTPPAAGQQAWTETVLHAFTGGNDGIFPGTGNLLAAGGDLFGTTAGQALIDGCGSGGRTNCDTVFELAPPPSGKTAWTYTLLYRFAGGADGYDPQGGLIAGPGGVLYGTTAAGGNTACQSSYTNLDGTTGCGTVFQLTPPTSGGGTWTKTILHVFTGGADGGIPLAALLADPSGSGVLYGVASTGGSAGCGFGSANCGVVFSLAPPKAGKSAWTETVLYTFLGGSDGLAPLGAPIMKGGTLYGTAMSGGYACNVYGCGTVFALAPPAKGKTAWTFSVLHAFQGGKDGGAPMAAVAFGASGALYGTTFQYGSTGDCGRFVGCGTAFKLAPPKKSATAWKASTLATFTGGATGGQSSAALTADANVLFGTTALGGSSQCPPASDPTCGGVVFELTP
jgi:hypothetical protein